MCLWSSLSDEMFQHLSVTVSSGDVREERVRVCLAPGCGYVVLM